MSRTYVETYLLLVVPVTLVIIILIFVGKFGIYGFGHLSILVLHAASRS